MLMTAATPPVIFARLATSRGMKIPHLDHAAFESLDPTPVTLIDFTARWCPPCRVLDKVLDVLDDEYRGRVQIVAVDVNDEPVLAERFNVRAMPTMVIRRGDREVGRIVGSRPRAFVAGVLDRALAGDVAIASP
jgi:thioredoxin 1